MKNQKPKFKIGDIVTKEINGFRRLIIDVRYEKRSNMLKVVYLYQYELLDDKYQATGYFDERRIGACSQDRLVSWLRGRMN